MSEVRHDPTYLYASQVGRWVTCTCGFKSGYGTASAVQLDFAQHLVKSVAPTRRT